MACVLIQLLIYLIVLWYDVDGTAINCTVTTVILEQVPDQITGTIAIANQSNEEIYWNQVQFPSGIQFPLNFMVVINNYQITRGMYTLQLHIYKLPRSNYDLPLWSADRMIELQQQNRPNSVSFIAHSTRILTEPCVIGVVQNTLPINSSILNYKLLVDVENMSLITLNIQSDFFPILFMLTDIPRNAIGQPTLISIRIMNSSSIIRYEAKKTAVLSADVDCTTLLFKVSEHRSMNLTVTMSAHVFTSISLMAVSAIYRIYSGEYLLFERTELVETLYFPLIIPETLIPITTPDNYTIEATISGSIPQFGMDVTLCEGVTYTRLVPGINNNVRISLLYTGPKLGTTIIGTIQQIPSNQSTWPLAGSNLAIVISSNASSDKSYQFTIFDQTFPIQFTLLDVNTIKENHQNVIFTGTITNTNDVTLWGGASESSTIIFNVLNKYDMYLSMDDSSTCQAPGKGWCSSAPNQDLKDICCSEYKCANGQCNLRW